MDLLGKTIIVMGIANKDSIATGIARVAAERGARLILTGETEKHVNGRLAGIAEEIGVNRTAVCDVMDPESMDAFFGGLTGPVHGLVHSIAFAERAELNGPHILASTPEGFQKAVMTSAYSYFECGRRLFPLMTEGGSLVAMSFAASLQQWANYNDMGVGKIALERFSMALAAELGALGIRSNIVSPGPMNTLSAAAIKGKHIVRHVARSMSPDGADTTAEEIGNVTAFLLSDASRAVNGQVLRADHGLGLWAHPTPWGVDEMDAAVAKIRELIASGAYPLPETWRDR